MYALLLVSVYYTYYHMEYVYFLTHNKCPTEGIVAIEGREVEN